MEWPKMKLEQKKTSYRLDLARAIRPAATPHPKRAALKSRFAAHPEHAAWRRR